MMFIHRHRLILKQHFLWGQFNLAKSESKSIWSDSHAKLSHLFALRVTQYTWQRSKITHAIIISETLGNKCLALLLFGRHSSECCHKQNNRMIFFCVISQFSDNQVRYQELSIHKQTKYLQYQQLFLLAAAFRRTAIYMYATIATNKYRLSVALLMTSQKANSELDEVVSE